MSFGSTSTGILKPALDKYTQYLLSSGMDQQKELHEIQYLLARNEVLLEQIYQQLEETKPTYKITGRIDLTGNAWENQQTNWHMASSNLALVFHAMMRLNPDFKPQTERIAQMMQEVENSRQFDQMERLTAKENLKGEK